MDLIIGLCFGIGSAIAVAVMWRLAERLREDLQTGEDEWTDDRTRRHPAPPTKFQDR